MNTKKMMIIFAAIFVGSITQAQDWSWTFQRWGDTCGLLFEATNLTASVKAAIRDDIANAYIFTTTNNLFTRIYTSEDSKYGTFVGFDGLQGNKGNPAGLGGWDYKLHNGNRYFHVKASLSDKYLQQIALTNQYKAAAKSLGSFLTTLNSITTNNVNVAKYLQMWWSMEQNKPVSLTYSRYQDHVLFFETAEDVKHFCGQIGEYEVIVPSILLFQQDAEKYGGVLWSKTVFRKKDDGVYEWNFIDIAYCQGKWRLVLPEL